MAGPRQVGSLPEVEVYRTRTPRRAVAPGFDDALERLLDKPDPAPRPAVPTGEVTFSRHAAARLDSRGIVLGPAELGVLRDAVDRLAEKGAREALVITADNAFLVGVASRTVITAMPRSEALGTVFTQIDSTYVAP